MPLRHGRRVFPRVLCRFETREESDLSTGDFGLKTRTRARRGRTRPGRDRFVPRRTRAFVSLRFALIAALVDAFAIVGSAVLVGVGYHELLYRLGGFAGEFAAMGTCLALLFSIFNILRHEYELPVYMTFSGHMRRTLWVWNISFFSALVFLFLMKDTASYSRGSAVLLYGIGFFALVAGRAFLVTRIKANALTGRAHAIRVVLVGSEPEVREFATRYSPAAAGVDIVASFVLRGPETLDDDITLAAASARVLRPDDIFILLPWSDTETIEACIEAFIKVPASVHLGPQRLLDRFSNVSIVRVGKIYSLHLVRRPLTMVDIVIKRAMDLAIALPLLVGLAPLLILVALVIRLDSRGPAFFLQRRHGFNQETFRIVKFRTMTVTEDDRTLRQAVRDDPRVTRVGRVLRRYNIDELPQLFNVVRGEMSLVGPRPHALIHNQYYERSIADYARRHNVKPGITGWAQVHGLRGEITAESVMRLRVEHDLFYIDNWSVGLDLRILLATLVSPKAFRNAY